MKRDNIKLDGIQKFLRFLKDGMALGRPRAAFGFGFMMHMEQVSKALRGHPLHSMVGEILLTPKPLKPTPTEVLTTDSKLTTQPL